MREFDLVVVGGGIVGAGIAQDAASRGLSVMLVEKTDFASGTSSKTTKLIHGGLRYLEQLHFGLTRELCMERALLEQLAPHLVRDFSFVLPITREQTFFAMKARLGLTLYDALAWTAGHHRGHRHIGHKEVSELAPGLSAQLVKEGLRFHDCITDDSRLVIEVIKSACAQGAIALNYLEAKGFDIESGVARAVQCRDRYSGADVKIRATACVNAAGIWTDNLAKMIDPNWQPRVTPAKGTHIMVPASAFETNTALFLPTPDHRYVFVVPWQRALMIGTTDTNYTGSLDNPLPQREEIDYLLSIVNSYSGSNRLKRSDITAAWSGLRPLVRDTTKSDTSTISREHLIFEGPGGIIGLIGGKLTNYRLMAAEVLEKVLKKHQALAARAQPSKTAEIMLGGWEDKQDFLTATSAIAARARKAGIEPATLDHLIASYGKDAQIIVETVERESSLLERIAPDYPQIMAEVPFCVLHELAVSLEDLLFRRLRLGMVHQMQCRAATRKVGVLMQSLLGWDDHRTTLEIAAVERTIDEHLQFNAHQETISAG